MPYHKLHANIEELPTNDTSDSFIIEIYLSTGQAVTLPVYNSRDTVTCDHNFVVSWGDGDSDTITDAEQAEATHTYASGGTYIIRITGLMESWSWWHHPTLSLSDAEIVTKILDFGKTGFIDTPNMFYGAANLTEIIAIGENPAFNHVGQFRACTSLTELPYGIAMEGHSFSTFGYGCTLLTTVYAGTFSTAVEYKDATTCSNMFYGAALTQQSVDNVLADFVANGASNGTLGLDGGTNSVPSATGLADKATLESRGWTVAVNT